MNLYLVLTEDGDKHLIPASSIFEAMEEAGIDMVDDYVSAHYWAEVHQIPTLLVKSGGSYID